MHFCVAIEGLKGLALPKALAEMLSCKHLTIEVANTKHFVLCMV
jgi:hypothetical protein